MLTLLVVSYSHLSWRFLICQATHKVAAIGTSLVQEAFVKVYVLMLDVFNASLLGPISVYSNCLGSVSFQLSVVSEFFKW
ncbi:hypothetical protein V6N13_068461 [Hibiscus sabdariffa]|uniref:Secreted protein n=1 Tax=Hibiscus sabdariffa TaxID=183260 RepID=A0ABR2QMU1_9ROSI